MESRNIIESRLGGKVATLLLLGLLVFSTSSARQLLTLQQFKDSARHNNISLRNARRYIEAAGEQRKEAFTKYFPVVSGTGFWFNANKGMAQTSVTPSEVVPAQIGQTLAQMMPAEVLASLASPITVSMMKNGTVAGIHAVQPIFAGGQIVNGNRLARVGEEVSRLQLRLSENEVERQVEQYYWQLVSLQEKLKTIDAVEAMLTDIHKDVEVAVRAGVAMPNDLMQVQLRQNDIESQKLKLNNAVGIVKMLMAQYCGLASPDFCIQEVIVGDSDEVSVPEPLPNDRQQALQQLSEYQLLGKQVEAARIERCLAVGQNLPTVAIGAGYNYHNLLDNNHTFGMVFATFSLPISDWWSGSHAIKRKKIAYQKALDEQRDKAELLDIRMQRAWNNVVEARQQLDIARRSIKQAEENLRLNRDYYRAGTSKMSDLLEAQLLCQQANDHHTDAFADLQNKLLEYRQSVGQ